MPYLLTTTITVERDDVELEVFIEGSYSPDYPETREEPTEGPEVEILKASLANGVLIELTEDENEKAEEAIANVFIAKCEDHKESLSSDE